MKEKENFKLVCQKYATKIELEAVNSDITLKGKRMEEFELFLRKLEGMVNLVNLI